MKRMVRIDGSTGEGGGQVLRSSLSLALITGRAVELVNIRARRAKPGLRPQHLQAVRAAASVGRAAVQGDRVGSERLSFAPRAVSAGDYRFDIGTAGATGLVLQTVCVPLALAQAPSRLRISGGTHVPLSPCFHYLDLSWRWLLERAGMHLALHMERAGFYPPGGGMVQARVEPLQRLRGLRLERRGRLRGVRGLSASARLPAHVAARQRERALARLGARGVAAAIAMERLDASSPGSLLLLLAELEAGRACFFALGARGKPAERVADEAVDELLGFLATDGAVDPYAADQLLLPLALAEEASILRTSRLTEHTRTNADIIRAFLPVAIEVEGEPGEPAVVRIRPAPEASWRVLQARHAQR